MDSQQQELVKQARSGDLAAAVRAIRSEVRSGNSLLEALKSFGFDAMSIEDLEDLRSEITAACTKQAGFTLITTEDISRRQPAAELGTQTRSGMTTGQTSR